MSTPNELICWNCTKRTKPGECIHCGVFVSDPTEVKDEDEIKLEMAKKFKTLEIPISKEKTIEVDLDQVGEIIGKYFEIKQMLLHRQPQFIVTNPGKDLDTKFKQLITDINELVEGFFPKIEKISPKTDNLRIVFIFIKNPNAPIKRTVTLLGLITLLSIFLAGIYNMNIYFSALDTLSSSFKIFTISINKEIIINALLFTVGLFSILTIKDIFPLLAVFRNNSSTVIPLLIPAPPIFELGTLGSVYRQNNIPVSREDMFNIAFWGPLISWIFSILLVAFTLPLAEFNSVAASAYSEHSIIASGLYEPLGLNLIVRMTNLSGLTNFNQIDPITTTYLLNPLTYAGLAGIYINGFQFLPAAHLSGGYVIRSVFGKTTHSIFSYLSIFLLISVHWLLAALLFFIHETLKTPEILNEESPRPKISRFAILILFTIVLLSFPVKLSWLNF